jgi:CRP-like cAMP-binding protein
MNMASDIEQIARIQLFEGLSSGEISPIIQNAHRKRIGPDEFFFYQGDPASTVFVLQKGQVKLSQITPDGQQIILRVIGPWSLFAIVALAPSAIYPVSAQAVETSTALAWPRETMVRFIESTPRLALNAMQIMSNSVQEFQDRYREQATERVERRLARSLLRLAHQTGRKTEKGVVIEIPLTRQDLAEMNGTTLYTVSRILSAWESAGLVVSGREKVTIRSPHALVRIAEDQ